MAAAPGATNRGQSNGTPTITVGEEIVDFSEPGWLDEIITAARQQS